MLCSAMIQLFQPTLFNGGFNLKSNGGEEREKERVSSASDGVGVQTEGQRLFAGRSWPRGRPDWSGVRSCEVFET
ncbi:hypothetical protein CEXT_212881 [Caerostris extrusa]|uniref:Uncharacterized protein n=1 Tax=Caerostris extrusa TaxID=172846 RepID=A0AAV4UDF5_CAEEX|nr:hypothetical protein CEXT_212881 [Caerostris extrusa]